MVFLRLFDGDTVLMGFPEDFTIVKESLCYSLHFVVLLLRTCAILLVIEGLNQRLKFHNLYHVQILQILSKDRIHVLSTWLLSICRRF